MIKFIIMLLLLVIPLRKTRKYREEYNLRKNF